MLCIFHHNNFFKSGLLGPRGHKVSKGHSRDNGLSSGCPPPRLARNRAPNRCGSGGPGLRLAEEHFRRPEETPNTAAWPEGRRLCPQQAARMLKGYTSFLLHLTTSRGGEGTGGASLRKKKRILTEGLNTVVINYSQVTKVEVGLY